MTRAIIIAVVVLVAIDIYTLADVLMAPKERFRSLNRFAWAVIVIVVEPIGPLLWFTLGKTRAARKNPPTRAPDDDPNFGRPAPESTDDRIARLEEELRKLDDEDDFPSGQNRD